MSLKKLVVIFLLFCCQYALAQDTIAIKLQEVSVSDLLLKKHSESQSVLKLSDSVTKNNKPSLTNLLNYNSLIYFKENGLGMVSSVSFRGTTAQQTAVIWNGININSQLNGQTDFNTISTRNLNSISVRSGGGSAIYGSSAIGGSVHLNNDLIFKKAISGEVLVDYGSFNTLGTHFNGKISSDKIASQIGFSRNSSDNDYTFPRTNKKNENGQYYNNSLNVNFGYKFNEKHFVKFYNQSYNGERHFSAALGSVSKSKYQNFDTRNLLEWKAFFNAFTSTLRFAHLGEEYKYFENAGKDAFSFGKSVTAIVKYNAEFHLFSKMTINGIVDYTQTKGSGSDLISDVRKIGSASILVKHNVTHWFLYELSSRKETTNQYQSPLLFSMGTVFKPLSFYRIKLNGSRNFRIPSFNDLYWEGSGNKDLKPESSYQAELGHEFFTKNVSLQLTGFGMKISDMIQWKPNLSGIWTPENVNQVKTYGLEVVLKGNKAFGNHGFDFSSSYGFTKSINELTGKELIYVPNHKWVTNFLYAYRRFSINAQVLYNGQVFTSSDNENILTDYMVFNSGIRYGFGKKQNYKVGFQTANITNENYQNVLGRPMPGRNYTFNINLNF
ncbi:TonB-dependent receptor [Flavobacterium amnicola]|uniref:TonB-dependent receptor n=1 Tax=Flavobacterium amnicola TaxID=2506422 RepID=A0A4Q1K1A8_9FLAO|nr:TonB-dependent receptor [Flavobacterium amnicola]RXR17706.1 TonB-dependent receptor [Flavobacterium amnicola]